jgi:WD40 repeat protein
LAIVFHAPLQATDLPSAVFSRDGKLLAVSDKTIDLFEVTGESVSLVAGGIVKHEKTVTSLAFSSNGLLASGDESGVIIVTVLPTSASTATTKHTLRGHSRGVYGLAFTTDGRSLASASGGRWVQLAGEVKIWDVESGQVRATLDGGSAPIALGPRGRKLAVTRDAERQVEIWTAAAY